MEYTVKIYRDGRTDTVRAAAGTNLLKFLRENRIHTDSPCGGNGSCGKCKVMVDGLSTDISEKERQLLGRNALDKGMRLACYNTVDADIEIHTGGCNAVPSIITEGKRRSIELVPSVSKEYVELNAPTLDDQVSDIERLLAFTGGTLDSPEPDIMRELPYLLRSSGFKATLLFIEGRLAAVEPGNTEGRIFGAAFDIGTTTVAAYLYDLKTGICLDVISMLNPQIRFGADVLSRIEYTMSSKEAMYEMHDTIADCVNLILKQLSEKNGIMAVEIYSAVFAGNTTMMHFLMNLYAGNMAVSPFIPVTARMHSMSAGSLGLNMNKKGMALVLPGVSAYIGADTVAAVLSSGMYEDADISLLVDIGTNGEIVLGSGDWLLSCSTAAGPAFEGANIRNGVGGISGAIDTVRLLPELHITTLGGKKPVGICGSGIVDAIAQLLEAGLLDETGRLADADELSGPALPYADRLVSIEGVKAFRLLSGSDEGEDDCIAVTQKDVRELQNAKAAIAAGIRTLVRKAGIEMNDISRVYLAGGFGSRINIESAVKIGLLPEELKDRIESIGNAAGSGAVEALLSSEMSKITNEIKDQIEYVELSASKEFVEEYVECMLF